MRKILIIIGTLLLAILLVLGACAPTPEETPALSPIEVTLKYDVGKPDRRFASQGPGWGYSVYFSPTATPFTINKVILFARLYGTEYADKKAVLEIWDENFEVLYSREMPATEFRPEEGGWVRVETNITVKGDFRVVFFTNSGGQAGGISIGKDSSGENKHSEVVRTGGLLSDWPPAMEEAHPSATTKWMIRVSGTFMPPAD